MNVLTSASGRVAPVCRDCGGRGRYTDPTHGGRVDMWKLPAGWAVTPFPEDVEHADGTKGDLFYCPSCYAALRAESSRRARERTLGLTSR